MDIIKKVDSYLETPGLVDPPRMHRGYHPSSASCVIKNEYDEETVVGQCLRCAYWSHKTVKPSNPMNARSKRITSIGKMMEQWEVEKYKELGIWRGNNIKFFDPDTLISGEVDCFVWDESNRETVGIEIKTGYGYQFEKEVIGKPSKKGKPKLDHLMQVMLYINYFKSTPLFKMVYIDRGNVARVEYNITLNKATGAAIVDGMDFNKDLTIPNILSRYNSLGKCLEDDALPRRDYQLQYTEEKIQLLFESNRLTKTDAREYESKKKLTIGDWRCGYCDYKDFCWKENKDV